MGGLLKLHGQTLYRKNNFFFPLHCKIHFYTDLVIIDTVLQLIHCTEKASSWGQQRVSVPQQLPQMFQTILVDSPLVQLFLC